MMIQISWNPKYQFFLRWLLICPADIYSSYLNFVQLDAPQSPGKNGLQAFLRRIPITEQQRYRNRLFEVTRENLLEVGEK